MWIGNNRGNTYSPCQTSDCWRFSFDESKSSLFYFRESDHLEKIRGSVCYFRESDHLLIRKNKKNCLFPPPRLCTSSFFPSCFSCVFLCIFSFSPVFFLLLWEWAVSFSFMGLAACSGAVRHARSNRPRAERDRFHQSQLHRPFRGIVMSVHLTPLPKCAMSLCCVCVCLSACLPLFLPCLSVCLSVCMLPVLEC